MKRGSRFLSRKKPGLGRCEATADAGIQVAPPSSERVTRIDSFLDELARKLDQKTKTLPFGATTTSAPTGVCAAVGTEMSRGADQVAPPSAENAACIDSVVPKPKFV